jgi:hypothetical protein
MKRLILAICIALLLSTVACYSATVNFAWDYDAASQTELGATGGFKLYQSKVSGAYLGAPVLTVAPGARTATISVPSGTYFWTVTAFDSDGNESDRSNEVTKKVLPNKPNNLKIP